MEKIIELFKKDKFANYCGIQIIEVRLGFAKCNMKITENHLNGLGTLMGGATYTLADFCFGLAANSHGVIAVSLNALICYTQKCDSGVITATAIEVSRGNKTGVYRVCITNEQDQLIAELTGTAYLKGCVIP
jgi:acyl-CoA thioesterase